MISAAFLGGMTQQVVSRFSAYYEYRASTDVSRNFVNGLEFPAVTLCNFNRWDTLRAMWRVAGFRLFLCLSQRSGLPFNFLRYVMLVSAKLSSHVQTCSQNWRLRRQLLFVWRYKYLLNCTQIANISRSLLCRWLCRINRDCFCLVSFGSILYECKFATDPRACDNFHCKHKI